MSSKMLIQYRGQPSNLGFWKYCLFDDFRLISHLHSYQIIIIALSFSSITSIAKSGERLLDGGRGKGELTGRTPTRYDGEESTRCQIRNRIGCKFILTKSLSSQQEETFPFSPQKKEETYFFFFLEINNRRGSVRSTYRDYREVATISSDVFGKASICYVVCDAESLFLFLPGTFSLSASVRHLKF